MARPQAWRPEAGSPLSLGPMARQGSPGARSISGSMMKHWRSAPWSVSGRMPLVPENPRTGAPSVMLRCYPTCSVRSRRTRRSAASGQMAPQGHRPFGAEKVHRTISRPPLTTRKCHDAIADRGAHAFGHSLEPVAFVSSLPPRRNAKPWKAITAGAVARNEALRASRYLGRALWRRWSGYHRRSRVETKVHCVKLLGQRLMARDVDRQVAELQVRIAVLNGYTALGIPVTEAVGQVCPGNG